MPVLLNPTHQPSPQFEVNALGPLRLVHALRPALVPAAAKVALISSKMGSLAATRECGSAGSAGYRRAPRGPAQRRRVEGQGGGQAAGRLRSTCTDHELHAARTLRRTIPPHTHSAHAHAHAHARRISKAAANMGGQLLALELAPQRIPVLMLHPGAVTTGGADGAGAKPCVGWMGTWAPGC